MKRLFLILAIASLLAACTFYHGFPARKPRFTRLGTTDQPQ